MKIAIYNDCDSRGGVLTYTLTLSAALRAAGVDVVVVTREPRGEFSESIVDDMISSATRVAFLPPSGESLADAVRLSDLLLKKGVDIFIPNYRQVPHVAAALCSRRTRIKSVGLCHNDHPSAYGQKVRFQSCLSKIVCPSPVTASHLKACLPQREDDIVTIPHGVRLVERSCYPFSGGVLRLLYHGRLAEQQKRMSLLIEIARRLAHRKVPSKLTLIGDGDARESCLAAAEEPLLREHLEVLSPQDWAGLSLSLANSHVTVLTSDYEGFCLSLAEGMGGGLPAVAFRCGGVIEQFVRHEKTGLLVEPGALDEFVEAIARIQSNPQLWLQLSQNARNLISREFSWSAVVDHYIALFNDTLCDPHRRKWALGRPAWIPQGGRSVSSVVERIGKEVGIWR